VHTGDSIVVAPSQTLTDKEYQMLRTASLKRFAGSALRAGATFNSPCNPIPPSRR
jgi:carbamoyl-phosphate synthase large subunit